MEKIGYLNICMLSISIVSAIFSYSSPGEKGMQKKTARIKKSCPCETEPGLVKELPARQLCLYIVRRGVFALSGLPADLEILLVLV